VLSDRGIQLIDVYTGSGAMLTGSARVAQMERERTEETLRRQETEAKRAEIEHRRAVAAAQIESLKAEMAVEDQELKRLDAASVSRVQEMAQAQEEILRSRNAYGEMARGTTNAS
jgi:circadian clock protein KaiC